MRSQRGEKPFTQEGVIKYSTNVEQFVVFYREVEQRKNFILIHDQCSLHSIHTHIYVL